MFSGHEVPVVYFQDFAEGFVDAAGHQFMPTVLTLELVLPYGAWRPEEEGLLENSVRGRGTLFVNWQWTRWEVQPPAPPEPGPASLIRPSQKDPLMLLWRKVFPPGFRQEDLKQHNTFSSYMNQTSFFSSPTVRYQRMISRRQTVARGAASLEAGGSREVEK